MGRAAQRPDVMGCAAGRRFPTASPPCGSGCTTCRSSLTFAICLRKHRSPAEIPTWIDGDYAAPSTPEAYERWLDQCVAWGVETLEHDWLVEVFFGVRDMRSEPGRATHWQEGIDAAARDRGITLQWCMGTPADFAQTTTLTQVTSVRTSGDHGYIATAGQLWAWFCTTNSLARSLDLDAVQGRVSCRSRGRW